MSVRGQRVNAGYTQKQLAKKMHVDQTAVSNWEIGRREPNEKNVKKMCKLFGCTVDELLKGGE